LFKKVLVANRSAVAARVLRTLGDMGIPSVAVYSEADAGAPYLGSASEARLIGPAQARESYLNQDALLRAVRETGADAVHPGYGFLSENAAFAHALHDLGVTFIGPAPRWLDDMGDKVAARRVMAGHGLPLLSGTGLVGGDEAEILAEAGRVGYPLLIKAAGGGGGIGMHPVEVEDKLLKAVERARALALRTFADGGVYFERLLRRPRHIEFQVVADRHGAARVLFERDCSVQRRYQKVIEEARPPGVPVETLDGLADTITGAMTAMGYDNIGTVEMLMNADGEFSFLEMNTRLQVEHGVTEEITGLDLVAAQIRAAAGDRLDDIIPGPVETRGHAIQARVYAEDPVKFLPSPGALDVFRPPAGPGIRVDTGYGEGRDITPFYDPLIAKVIASAPDRAEAIDRLAAALENFAIEGPKTNIPFLVKALTSDAFRAGRVHTGLTGEILG